MTSYTIRSLLTKLQALKHGIWQKNFMPRKFYLFRHTKCEKRFFVFHVERCLRGCRIRISGLEDSTQSGNWSNFCNFFRFWRFITPSRQHLQLNCEQIWKLHDDRSSKMWPATLSEVYLRSYRLSNMASDRKISCRENSIFFVTQNVRNDFSFFT